MRRPALLSALLLLLVPSTAAAAGHHATGRVLVTTAPGAAATQARAAGARVVQSVPEIGLSAVEPPPGQGVVGFVKRLRREPGVEHAQVEHRFQLRFVPTDPSLSEQGPGLPAGVPAEWELAREDLYAGWDLERGDGAKVAIIDTGIDASHPDLRGKIAATADFDSTPGDGPATVDEVGHGTHVASLACGAADGRGMVGAGLNCGLIVEKSDLTDFSVAAAIVDAVKKGADAINMSFGDDGSTRPSQGLVDAVNYAYAHGVVLVAAAADDPVTEQGSPANLLQPTGSGPDLQTGKGLSVTAAQYDDTRAAFAGRGSQISLAAYGTYVAQQAPFGLLGAFPGNRTELEEGSLFGDPPCQCRTTFDGDSRYAYLEGTSMASPQVAAIAALVGHYNPGLDAADVIRILKSTARRPAGTEWGPELGWGIVDAGAALAAAQQIDRTPPSSHARSPRRVHRRRFTVRWHGHDGREGTIRRSGIAYYDIYRSKNGGEFHRIARTRGTRLRYKGQRGSVYRFLSIAVDRDGNRQAMAGEKPARTRVSRHRRRHGHLARHRRAERRVARHRRG